MGYLISSEFGFIQKVNIAENSPVFQYNDYLNIIQTNNSDFIRVHSDPLCSADRKNFRMILSGLNSEVQDTAKKIA